MTWITNDLSIWQVFFGYWNHPKILILQIDYVDGASSGPPRLRSRGHHPPPLPPSKSTKPCIHKQHRTHPAPVAYNSDLGSSSEVTLATSHKHYSHRVTHHHHHHSSSHNHNHPMPTVYMPGGHVDMQYHVHAQPQQPVKPPSSRGSHSSDTSSAYSGSDTMQVSICILAFSTIFCPITTDMSGNTVWPQAPWSILAFLINFCPLKM